MARAARPLFADAHNHGALLTPTDSRYNKVAHENRSVEISPWFTEQSIKCIPAKTALIYIFPDDFGGNATSGPASLWSLKELRSLHGQDDASRGATFVCRIAGADCKKPLGIFTILPGLQQSLNPGWPALVRHGAIFHYRGPPPKILRPPIPPSSQYWNHFQ